jgi:hypothetical protein
MDLSEKEYYMSNENDPSDVTQIEVESLSDEDLESVAGGAADVNNVSTGCITNNAETGCTIKPA